ncbi:MAG: EamA family transporter [Peptococcaceae bacterium]|jgi:drug/metabolite transporter (DMT)-like permease|nr:EamA family transporter [Peptococcaceae bacterium]MBQ2449140.1 EamA family transporter [Peptococcaceae bacterium]MBQ5683926.1 EamA family transporter [Peptococcaceae bacterium]
MDRKTFMLGAFLALLPGVLWGLSGVFGQYLFQQRGISAEWLVTTRLLISGSLMLIISFAGSREKTLAIFKDKTDTRRLVIFAIFGLMAVQLTYFVAIAKSNAPTATILQYVFPVMIVLYTALRSHKLPNAKEVVAVILAMVGIFLLVTHGNPGTLNITVEALIWGLTSAVAMAFYTMYPGNLQKRWGSPVVVGWGMLFGGIALNFYHPFWAFTGDIDLMGLLMIAFIILFATFGAFYIYLVSVTMIGATYASLFACIEPLASAFFSVVGLNLVFNSMDWIGAALIMITMFLLSWKTGEK